MIWLALIGVFTAGFCLGIGFAVEIMTKRRR